ncbi:hypothetical protein CEQ90_12870 [Lewinellaceae bacterium SD302]|nr:hypothetical protein CEQ90_12870 [Lewinellaceae bacterium SD302]
MIRYSRTNLKKLETLFKELEYTIRYEKGNFQSGYCVVEDRRIAVVNKFYDVEGRMNCLLEILSQQDVTPYLTDMTEPSLKFYEQVKSSLNTEEE